MSTIEDLSAQIQALQTKCNALDSAIAHATARLSDLEHGRNCDGLSVAQWLTAKRDAAAGLESDRAALTEAMYALGELGREHAEAAERAHIEAISANVTTKAMDCFSRLTAKLAEAKEELEALGACFDVCEKEIADRGGPTDPRAQPYVRLMASLPGASGPNLPIAARFLAS